MRTLGRRAAIGVTTVALLLAAAGTSLAAVRAAREEGGVAASGPALPAGRGPDRGPETGAGAGPTTGAEAGPGPAPAPVADTPPGPGGVPPLPSQPSDPAVGPGPAPPEPSAPGADGAAPAQDPPPVVLPPQPSASTARLEPVPTVPPAGGPTPTTVPGQPSPTIACPSDIGRGALPPRAGPLRAVDFVLPWPGVAPLYLLPQASAPRGAGAKVSIVWSSVGGLSGDGSSLTLEGPASLEYVLSAGRETARGSIRFAAPALPVSLYRQACPDRSFVLYDVERAQLARSPLRIVGVVAPTGVVSVDGGGGTAHFRAGPGSHQVILVTANDAGVAGSLVIVTVDVA